MRHRQTSDEPSGGITCQPPELGLERLGSARLLAGDAAQFVLDRVTFLHFLKGCMQVEMSSLLLLCVFGRHLEALQPHDLDATLFFYYYYSGGGDVWLSFPGCVGRFPGVVSGVTPPFALFPHSEKEDSFFFSFWGEGGLLH